MRIGTHIIPKYRLQSLIDDTKKIYEQFNGRESEPEYIAHTLGHQPKSGSFVQKLADMRSYGLIDRRGKISVSELGKKITYGTESEKTEALDKILRNIPLWGIFLDKFGVNIKEETFWVDLAQITGVERLEAQTKANEVRKAYLEDVRYYKPVEKAQELPEPKNPIPEPLDKSENKMIDHPERVEASVEDKVRPESIEEIKFGDIRIWIPKQNAKAVIMAKKLLELYEEGITKDAPTAS
ncbi:MAG: hypothetical protein O8C62_10700 [Candidatus Methanoperedens sp.]|nr:hypothetical protein [Candidatus Methanoperedens sp.]